MSQAILIPIRDLEIQGVPYAVYSVYDGVRTHVELRPLTSDGLDEPYGHASSLLDDHEYDYYAGDGLFQAAVDTAKTIARDMGAAYSQRTWLTGKLERITNFAGWRDHLNGKPISNGEQLQWLDESGRWCWARYESWRETVFLHLERGILEYSPRMTLRWRDPEHG